jgi:hypothetical protein
MEKERRDNLRAVVARARGAIEDSLARQLIAFGFFRDHEPQPREDLRLRPEQEDLYPRLRDALLRQGRAVQKGDVISPEAVTRFVREAGATWVNRLAALRALETRGLLDPAAAFVSDEYAGSSPRGGRLREEAASDGRPLTRDESIRAGIEDACRELGDSVRVLFDLGDEQSLLWPDPSALIEVLKAFSSDVTHEDWSQPDVLGWVYQYYNTDANAELKKRKNKTTGFKYSPDDIPIANQFYTPHWVVRVLTDNTLGRLWLESQDRLPQLDTEPYRLAEARRDVPHAAKEPEAFKAWLLEEPDPLTDRMVDRLCRFVVPLPSRPFPRAKKSPRDIKVLDPACGSGHFLLYAFDILFVMYREAEPDLDPREIPALILAQNLFGVDVDLRAAQLAAFMLYLKARTTLARIDPEAPLEIRGLNIVVADAHIGNDPRKAAFLDRYKDEPEIRQLYAKILSDLDNTNVLGSLLKVRTEFESLFGRVRAAKREDTAWTPPGQQALLDVARQKDLTETFRSFSGRAWRIGELLDDLRAFEREIAPSQDVGARLFVLDLERSVGLLSVLSQEYDTVLMNPPYGDMPPAAKDYLAGNKRMKIPAHYQRTSQSLDAAFLDQGQQLLTKAGFLGALVPRAFMHFSSHEPTRREILSDECQLAFLHDYGLGILDGATVRTAALVAQKGAGTLREDPAIAFQRLSYYPTESKVQRFTSTLPSYIASGPNEANDFYVASQSSLTKVPGMPYSYWATDSLRALFREHRPLDGKKVLSHKGLLPHSVGAVRQGIATQDDVRFTRFWWELTNGPSLPDGWHPYAKGGSSVLFYTRLDLAVDWRDDGKAVKEWIRDGLGDHPTRHLRNLNWQGKEGLTWRAIAWDTRRFGYVPERAMFSNRGSMVFVEPERLRTLLGFLNSKLAAVLILCQTNEREWHISEVAALPISDRLESVAIGAVPTLLETLRHAEERDETCRDFTAPDLRLVWERGRRDELRLDALIAEAIDGRRRAERGIDVSLEQLDTEVFELYGISSADRSLILNEMARRPQSESGYSETEAEEDDGDGRQEEEGGRMDQSAASSDLSLERTRDLVARWLSFYLKEVLESDANGIIPIPPMAIEPGLIIRLREAIERDLGKDAGHALLSQAPAYLGTKDVTEWLTLSGEETIEIDDKKAKLPLGFAPWHVDLYRKRPIFWLLSSEGFEKGQTRFRFQAYIYYLKLTPDTLPRLVEHYLEGVQEHAQQEWNDAKARAARLEGRAAAAAKTEAQEWLNTVDALKRFRAAIEDLRQGPPKAERVSVNAKWIVRTIAQVRGGQDIGHGYQPDVDYGVRVNIRPLIEKKLLPKVILRRLGG